MKTCFAERWYDDQSEILEVEKESENLKERWKELCVCKKSEKINAINQEDIYKNKFYRCTECGYVIEPMIDASRRVPRCSVYVVDDKTNPLEPERCFYDEKDAKDYVEFCGLSEKQIYRQWHIVD
ncbi:hypothetical protein DW159_01245 [Coprococcus sp. AM14-16]|uniref:hypothetical protein n=1 Tax=Coprococcus TaxID=33042 RepID=UPI000E4153D3|nr:MULTISPECIES: hypothetical protein [Coprococcus]RGD40653.1 hypothetical protein DW159_01245 [Coprococcus sp. AM14-16]